MRRALHILFHLATTLSVLLLLTLAVLWPRSYWRSDRAWLIGHTSGLILESQYGRVQALWARYPIARPHAEVSWRSEAAKPPLPAPGPWSALGVDWIRLRFDISSMSYRPLIVASDGVRLPHGYVMLLAAILPACWLWRRRRRPLPGCCPRCGYDLRASKEQCPECGMAITPKLTETARK